MRKRIWKIEKHGNGRWAVYKWAAPKSHLAAYEWVRWGSVYTNKAQAEAAIKETIPVPPEETYYYDENGIEESTP